MAYKGALCDGKVRHEEAQGCEEPGEPCAAPELATRERCVPAAEDGSVGCCAAAASLPLRLHDCDNPSHVAEALTRGGSLVETSEGASQGCLTEAAQDAARPRDTERAPRSVHFADEPELRACDEQEMGHSSVGNPPEAANLFELRTCRCGSALDQGEGPATPPLSAAADPSPTRADGSVHFADQPELMDCGEPELEDIADHEQALSPLPPEELSERQRDAVAGGEQSPDVGAGENFLAQLQAAKALLREGDQSAEDGHLTMAVGVYTQVLGMGLCEDLARDVHFKRAVALERLEILRGDTGLYLNAYDDYSRSIVRGRARHAVRYLHRGRLSVMQCQQLHFPNVLDEDVLCRRLRRAEEDFEAALRLDSTGSLGVRQRAQAELDKLEEIAHFTTKRQMREEEREKLEHEEWDRKRRERVLLKSLGLEPDRHGESASPGDEDLCECGGPIRYGINDEGMDTAVCRDCGVEQHHCYRIDRTDVGGELNDDQCGDPGRVGRHCEELSSSAGPAPMDLRPLSTSARTCVDDNLHCRKAGPKPEDLRPENRRDADRQVQFETNKVRLRQVAKSIPVADEVVQHVEMLFDALDTPLEYKCAECPGHIERFKAELKELNEEERGLQSQPDREAESSDHDETGDDEGKQLRAFRAMDKDGSGFIISEDLRDFLEGEGVAREELGEITDAEVDEMIRGADVGPDGRISYEKFVKMMLRVKFERKEQDFRYRLREAEYRISAKDEITSSAEGLVHLECGHCLCPPCHARIEANLREKKAAVKAAESMEEKENAKAEQDEAEKCPARECAEKFVKRTPPREKDGGRQAQIAAIIYVAGRWAGKRYSRLLCEIVKSCNVGVEQFYHGDHAGRQLAPLKRATAGRTNLRGLDKKMFRIRDTRDELLAACGRWAESAGLSLDAQKTCLKALRQNATAIKLGTNRRDGPLLIAAVIVLARSVMSEEEAADAAKDFCARLERHLKVELPDPAAIAAKAEELKQTPEFQRVVPEWRRVSQPKKATPLDTIRPLDPKRKQARKAESAKLHRKTMQRVRNAKSPGQLRAVARGVGIAEDAIQSVSGKKEMMMQQLKKLIEREMRVQEKFEAENGLCPSDDPFCAPARNKPGRESKGSTRSCSTATPPRGSDHDDSPVPKVDFTRKDLDDPQRVVKRLEAAIAAKRRARARPAARVDLFDDQHDDQQRSTQRGSSRSRSRYSPYGT